MVPDQGRRLARGEETREAYTRAAVELLGERPPSGISGRDLAERSGKLYAHIYHQWGTKDALLLAALTAVAATVDPAALLTAVGLGTILRAACDVQWKHQDDAMRLLCDLVDRAAAHDTDPNDTELIETRAVALSAVVALRAGIAQLTPPENADPRRHHLLERAALLESRLLM